MAKLLLRGLVGAPVIHLHAGAVTPDQVGSVEACEGVGIGAQQVIHRGGEACGCDCEQQHGDCRWEVVLTEESRQLTDYQIAYGAAERVDAGVAMARGMHAVGQQRPGQAAREIDPHAGAGEAGVTDGFVGAGVAAGPALVTRLPPQASRCRLPPAEFRQPRIGGLQEATRRVEDTVDGANKPAWPAAPPNAKAFSSCTAPRMMRPRQVQCSVAAVSDGGGCQVRPDGSRSLDSGQPWWRSMAMPSSMKLMSE